MSKVTMKASSAHYVESSNWKDSGARGEVEAAAASASISATMRTRLLSMLSLMIFFTELFRLTGLLLVLHFHSVPHLDHLGSPHLRTLSGSDLLFLTHHIKLTLLSQMVILAGLMSRVIFGLDTPSSFLSLFGMLLQAVLAGTHLLATTVVLGPNQANPAYVPGAFYHWSDFVSIEGGSGFVANASDVPSDVNHTGSACSMVFGPTWNGRPADGPIADLLSSYDWFRVTMATSPIPLAGIIMLMLHGILRSSILLSSFKPKSLLSKFLLYAFVLTMGSLVAATRVLSWVFGSGVALGSFVASTTTNPTASEFSNLVASEGTVRGVVRIFRLVFFVPFVVEIVIAALLQSQLKQELYRIGELLRADIVNMREFMRKFSHTARTALTSILPNTQELSFKLLEEGCEDPILMKQIKTLLETLRLSGSLTTHLIRDLVSQYQLKTAGITLSPTFADVATLLNSQVESLKKEYLNEGVEVSVSIHPTKFPQLFVDQILLARVIGNILSNSFKYTFNGTIKVELLCHGRSKKDIDVQIIVRDTGRGIGADKVKELNPPEWTDIRKGMLLKNSKVFPRFAQRKATVVVNKDETKRNVLSLGEGIGIVLDIVRKMNGSLVSESVEGVGSTFVLSFSCRWRPPQSQPLSPISPSQELADPKKTPDLKLVIAEDSPSNRLVIRTFLTRLGYEDDSFCIFNNGRLALEYLQTRLQKIPENLVVLTDINMPVMNGPVLCAHIRADRRLRHLPVLAMTATASANSLEGYCKKFQLDGRLDKPYTPDDLRRLLMRARDVSEERRVSKDGEDDGFSSSNWEIVVSLDEGDEVGDSLDDLGEEVEKRIFGAVLSESSLKNSSQSAWFKVFLLEVVAAAAMWFLIPDTTVFCLLVIIVNVACILGRLLFPSHLSTFENLKFLCILQPMSILLGRESHFLARPILASTAATMCESDAHVLGWPGLALLLMFVSEIFGGGRIFSSEEFIASMLVVVVFGPAHFVEAAIDSAARNEKENSRLHSFVRSDEKHREEQKKFLRRTSHDLSNAMSGLDPILVSLYKKTQGFPSFKKGLLLLYQRIHWHFRMIKSGVSQLMEYFRMKAKTLCLIRSEISLHSLVSDVVGQTLMFSDTYVLGENLIVVNEIPKDVWANVDRRRLSAILENFLSNSEKSNFKSHVKLTARIVRTLGESSLEFVVEDDGCGVTAQKMQCILADPFTGKNRKHVDPTLSAGFSLFMGKQFAKMMGGDLQISSEGTGKGTRVRFYCHIEPISKSSKQHKSDSLPPTEPVVIVEDSIIIRMVLGTWLRGAGFKVLGFDNARKVRIAMDKKELLLPSCLCFLVDCTLEETADGVKLARDLVKLPGCPPVIPMSSDEQRLLDLRGDFTWVLSKPVAKSDDLLSFLHRVL